MHQILILGAGRIGTLIAHWLAASEDYRIWLGDIRFDANGIKNSETKNNYTCVPLDASNSQAISDFLQTQSSISTIVSCLPYFHNAMVADVAKAHHLNYFDLTEDVAVVRHVQEVAAGSEQVFIPQCGLAPGMVNIIASHLMRSFQMVETAKLRVGALPVTADNALHYALTWSTDGLINQYGNACVAIRDTQLAVLQPLEGLETLEIDGQIYEAFNTSGGLGTMAMDYVGKIRELDYKTLRYPGHCEKMRFLMNDLRLNTDREVLKHILERALPKVTEDVVIIYISIQGEQAGELVEKHYIKKFYGETKLDLPWSAIQLTTAAGLCAVLDYSLSHPGRYAGYIKQQDFDWNDIIQNRFGRYFSA
jgi:saccharopine dehydrogenase-like NADP-dependent oxidoreductase